LPSTVFAPSIIYDRDDPWVTIMRRLSLLPVVPISGSGKSRYQPIWARDVADAVIASLARDGSERFELAGPEVLTYDDMARTIARAAGRERPLVHVPLPLVRSTLIWLRRVFGEPVFATWEEAELLEIQMGTPRGPGAAERLGVEPQPMARVLG